MYIHMILGVHRSDVAAGFPVSLVQVELPMCLDKPAFDLHARPHRGHVCWLLLGLVCGGGGEFSDGRLSIHGICWGLSRWSSTSGCL